MEAMGGDGDTSMNGQVGVGLSSSYLVSVVSEEISQYLNVTTQFTAGRVTNQS